jgi:glycosyltransferase involved in cell wall biosynthesis
VPKVSVIVPNYNHAKFLNQRLDSIFNQTYQDFEVILLDDCSTDNSIEILKQYASDKKVSHFVANNENSGSPFKQWQKGIELASGDYIWIAESDDTADLNFLETLLKALNANCDLVYCRSKKIDEQGKILNEGYFWADGLDEHKWKHNFEANGKDEIKNSFVYRNVLPNASSCIFKKSLASGFENITGFKYAGDWFFWTHLIKNIRITYIAQTLNSFRAHSNTSRTEKSKEEELIRIREYFSVINYAIKVSRENFGKAFHINFRNYDWIFEDMYRKRKLFGLSFLFPDIPMAFLPYYYLFILRK